MQDKAVSKAKLEASARGGRRTTWGRKNEEYCADFILVSRRSLSEAEWRLFRFHFLLGADVHLCAKRMGVDRGTAYYLIYRIMERLGAIFMDLKPYALYPLDDYFNGSTLLDLEQRQEMARDLVAGTTNLVDHSLSKLLDVPVKTAA